MGIYAADKKCVQEIQFENFEENTLPESIIKTIDQKDSIPMSYYLQDGKYNVGANSVVSNISNLT